MRRGGVGMQWAGFMRLYRSCQRAGKLIGRVYRSRLVACRNNERADAMICTDIKRNTYCKRLLCVSNLHRSQLLLQVVELVMSLANLLLARIFGP